MAKVLIVDDEFGILRLLSEIVESIGHQAFLCSSASTVLRFIKKEKPDLILLDVQLPDGDGIELLKKIKKSNPELPVIIVTGYGSVDIAEKARKFGADEYFLKPLRPEKIISYLKNRLKIKESTQSLNALRKRHQEKQEHI